MKQDEPRERATRNRFVKHDQYKTTAAQDLNLGFRVFPLCFTLAHLSHITHDTGRHGSAVALRREQREMFCSSRTPEQVSSSSD